LRVFLDTNVLVSAFTTRGICTDVVTEVLSEHQLVTGETVLAELTRILTTKVKVPAAAVSETEALLRREADVVSHAADPGIQLREQDDVAVLGEVIEGLAAVLVTGDRDLLDVADQLPVETLSPRGFWEKLQRRS
jgi:uncharacterized protein